MCQDLLCPNCGSSCALCCKYDQTTGTCEYLPEPADLTFMRTGQGWMYTFWYRDDQGAKDAGYDEPGSHWWNTAEEDGGDGPVTWGHVRSQPNPCRVTLEPLDTS